MYTFIYNYIIHQFSPTGARTRYNKFLHILPIQDIGRENSNTRSAQDTTENPRARHSREDSTNMSIRHSREDTNTRSAQDTAENTRAQDTAEKILIQDEHKIQQRRQQYKMSTRHSRESRARQWRKFHQYKHKTQQRIQQ